MYFLLSLEDHLDESIRKYICCYANQKYDWYRCSCCYGCICIHRSLLEDLYETVEKHQELLDKNIHTQVMLDHIEAQLKKALDDIEDLKDKVRQNGNSY